MGKAVKKVFIIVLLLAVLALLPFATDMACSLLNTAPLFSVYVATAGDGGTSYWSGMGYSYIKWRQLGGRSDAELFWGSGAPAEFRDFGRGASAVAVHQIIKLSILVAVSAVVLLILRALGKKRGWMPATLLAAAPVSVLLYLLLNSVFVTLPALRGYYYSRTLGSHLWVMQAIVALFMAVACILLIGRPQEKTGDMERV